MRHEYCVCGWYVQAKNMCVRVNLYVRHFYWLHFNVSTMLILCILLWISINNWFDTVNELKYTVKTYHIVNIVHIYFSLRKVSKCVWMVSNCPLLSHTTRTLAFYYWIYLLKIKFNVNAVSIKLFVIYYLSGV